MTEYDEPATGEITDSEFRTLVNQLQSKFGYEDNAAYVAAVRRLLERRDKWSERVNGTDYEF